MDGAQLVQQQVLRVLKHQRLKARSLHLVLRLLYGSRHPAGTTAN